MFRVLFTIIMFSELTISLSQESIPKESSQWYFTLGYTNYTEGLEYNSDGIPEFSGSEYQYSMVDSTLFGNGLSFGLAYERNRWRFPMSIGVNIFRQNIKGIERSILFNEFLTQRRVRYVESGFYGEISLGMSYTAIKKRKFALMPILRLNPEIRIGSIVRDSITTVFATDYYYNESSLKSVKLNDRQYDGLVGFIRTLTPSIGVSAQFKLNDQLYANIETGYQWQHFSRLSFGPYQKKSSGMYGKIEFGFQLNRRR